MNVLQFLTDALVEAGISPHEMNSISVAIPGDESGQFDRVVKFEAFGFDMTFTMPDSEDEDVVKAWADNIVAFVGRMKPVAN